MCLQVMNRCKYMAKVGGTEYDCGKPGIHYSELETDHGFLNLNETSLSVHYVGE